MLCTDSDGCAKVPECSTVIHKSHARRLLYLRWLWSVPYTSCSWNSTNYIESLEWLSKAVKTLDMPALADLCKHSYASVTVGLLKPRANVIRSLHWVVIIHPCIGLHSLIRVLKREHSFWLSEKPLPAFPALMDLLTRCNAKTFVRCQITSHGSPSDFEFIFHLKFSSLGGTLVSFRVLKSEWMKVIFYAGESHAASAWMFVGKWHDVGGGAWAT